MSSATVALAAEAYGVEPARIAKTLSLRIGERVVLIVTSGTSRMDNKKVKALFGGKPKMLGLDEVAEITGHEVGGVCPFGLKTPLPVYCDVSLKAFDEVVPAAGSTHSAVRIAPSRMAELVGAEWVDVCRGSAVIGKPAYWSSSYDLGRSSRRSARRAAGGGHAGIGFEHRAARSAELRGVLPQARHDPVDVRNLRAAQPEDVGRAGHLLFQGSPIFLRQTRRLERRCRSRPTAQGSGQSGCVRMSDPLSDCKARLSSAASTAPRSGFKRNKLQTK